MAIIRLTKQSAVETIRTENAIGQSQECRSLFEIIGASLAVLWKDWPKNMETASVGEGGFVLRGECPYCHHLAAFRTVAKPYLESHRIGDSTMVGVARCEACHEYILGILKTSAGHLDYHTHYPIGLPDDTAPIEIPEPVRSEFQEALRCHWAPIKAFRATVLMCRRSLQASCDMENAIGNDLFHQIDDLAAKQRITEPLRKMAHRIRLLGKKGAHGDYSDIDDTITEKDADDAIKFMTHYFEHVYVLPQQLEEDVP